MSKLDGSGDLGSHIVNLVKNKTVVPTSGTGAGGAANVSVDASPNPNPANATTVSAATVKGNVDGGADSRGRTSAEGKKSLEEKAS
jgi:hypothetical protein